MKNTARNAAAFRNTSGTNHSVLRFDAVSTGSNPSNYQIEAASKQSNISPSRVGYVLRLLALRVQNGASLHVYLPFFCSIGHGDATMSASFTPYPKRSSLRAIPDQMAWCMNNCFLSRPRCLSHLYRHILAHGDPGSIFPCLFLFLISETRLDTRGSDPAYFSSLAKIAVRFVGRSPGEHGGMVEYHLRAVKFSWSA